MATSYALGKAAELLARMYLMFKGYAFVAGNFKTPVGEIDLIMRQKKTLIFVEVKLRQTVEEAADAISVKQRQRISRAAQWFLKNTSHQDYACRFDAVLICKGRFLPKFKQIKNAW